MAWLVEFCLGTRSFGAEKVKNVEFYRVLPFDVSSKWENYVSNQFK